MKIHIRELNLEQTRHVNITGHEDFLEEIYKYFPHPSHNNKPLITGSISLQIIGEGIVQVKGSLNFSPFLNCSRCNSPITWTLSEAVDLLYQEKKMSPNDLPKNKELSKEELNEYNYDPRTGFFDLEQIISEAINLAIPSTISPEDQRTPQHNCLKLKSDDILYSTKTKTVENRVIHQQLKALLNK